jgi:hypothetical protein
LTLSTVALAKVERALEEITVTELGSDISYDFETLPGVTTGNSLNITSMPFYN